MLTNFQLFSHAQVLQSKQQHTDIKIIADRVSETTPTCRILHLTEKSATVIIQEMASATGRLFTRRRRVRPGCIRQGAGRGRRWSPAAVPPDPHHAASRSRPAARSIAELLRRHRVPARRHLSRSPDGRRRRRGVGRRARLLSGRSSAGTRLRVGGRGLQYSLPGSGRRHDGCRRVVPATRPHSFRHARR